VLEGTTITLGLGRGEKISLTAASLVSGVGGLGGERSREPRPEPSVSNDHAA